MSATVAQAAIEALRQPPLGRSARCYSSDLSVDEAVLVHQAGFDLRGLVSGSAVFHAGLAMRSWSTNEEIASMSAVMYQAREAALRRLAESGRGVGADGVAGVRLNIRAFEGYANVVQFVAVGTALSHRSSDSGRPFFTSDLSGKDLYLLVEAGYWPLGLVMGCCVYHIAHRQFAQWVSSQTKNVEMTNYTEALYEARELAMGRMQDEALRHGADGVVGVTTSERSHIWGSNVIEFFALGTAVKLVSSEHRRLDPKMVMALNDVDVLTKPGAIVRSD